MYLNFGTWHGVQSGNTFESRKVNNSEQSDIWLVEVTEGGTKIVLE